MSTLLLAPTGCSSPPEGNDSSPNTMTTNADNGGNRAPIADPGMNLDGVVGEPIDVNGSSSSDPDNDVLTPAWTLEVPEGSSATLEEGSEASFRARFTPDIVGIYKLTLIVSDGSLESEPVPVYVRVEEAGSNNQGGHDMGQDMAGMNRAPIAHAGEDAMFFLDEVIGLDGTGSSDPDDDPLTYQWALTQSPPDSIAALDDDTSSTPTLNADRAGLYEFELIVFDGELESEPDRVLLNVRDTTPTNSPPVALITDPPLSIVIGKEARFDGSLSNDPDNDDITFSWTLDSKPEGSLVDLEGVMSATSTLTPDVTGDYVVTLVVSDEEDSSAPQSVTLTATEIENTTPVAIADVPPFAFPEQRLMLDGTASFDDDGDTLTYQWRLTSQPAGSTILLEDATSSMATITPVIEGDYVVTLVVSDGFDTSDVVESTIQVAARPEACLVISEYIEGDGNNKAVELYNCDTDSLDLTGKYICIVRGGTSPPTCSSPLALVHATSDGMLASGAVVGACNSGFDMNDIDAGDCAIMGGAITFNGDDGLIVFEDLDANGQFDITADAILDAFGEPLNPPSSKTWEDVTYRRCDLTPYGMSAAPFVVDDLYDEFLVDDYTDFGVAPSPSVVCGAGPMNRAPVANAGPDRNVTTGQSVTLSAALSDDPDNDPLTYQWSLTQSPMNSTATLDDPTLEMPSFMADLEGDYVFDLIVSDSALQSPVDSVTVTAFPPFMPGASCLIISEVIEGSGSGNKALELYNCGIDPIDLDGVRVCVRFNGSASCGQDAALSGILPPGDTYGVCNAGASHPSLDQSACDLRSSAATFNGDDVIIAYRDTDLSSDLDLSLDEPLDFFGDPANPPASKLWENTGYRRCNFTPYLGALPFTVTDYFINTMVEDEFSDFGTAPTAPCP